MEISKSIFFSPYTNLFASKRCDVGLLHNLRLACGGFGALIYGHQSLVKHLEAANVTVRYNDRTSERFNFIG